MKGTYMLFVCPKCMEKLNITDSGAARCPRGHSYDKSRYGYYNLLLSERGGVHGDNREMVLARRAFLGSGAYEQLAARIAQRCAELLADGGVMLDAGCGEGYYTAAVRQKLDTGAIRIAAFDISKDAVREAAKKHCADCYAVASSYKIPLGDGTVDLVLNTFSPQALSETARVLKCGGHFVMAIPAEEHLFGLKSAIYETPYKNEVQDTALEGFELLSSEEIKYELQLGTGEEIRNLFMMTPYAYRTKPSDREKVLSLTRLTTQAHFLVLTYVKKEV